MRAKVLSRLCQYDDINSRFRQFELLRLFFLVCAFMCSIGGREIRADVSVPSSITTNTTWTAANNPYVVSQGVTVQEGVTLTIDPGVVVKFGQSDSLYVNGNLVADGASGTEIIFTSLKDDSDGHDTNGDGTATAPAPGDWGGLYFRSTSTGSLLNHVIVRYGKTGIYVYQSSPTIQNNTVTDNGADGIYLYSASPTISGNVITDNNGYGIFAGLSSNPQILANSLQGNTRWAICVDPPASGSTIQGNELLGPRAGIFVRAGDLTTDTVWSSDSVYVINDYRDSYTMGGLTVDEGVALTIQPGVVTKFEGFAGLRVLGSLIAEGTADGQIGFTSLRDDSLGGDTNGDGNLTTPAKNDWGGISFSNTCQQGVLNHAVVRYGGRTYDRICCFVSLPAIYIGVPNVQIRNSVISDNGYDGIRISLGGATSSNVVIENNTISRNGDSAYGITLAYGPAVITRNVISENWHGMSLVDSPNSSIYLNGMKIRDKFW
jgi:parallel beta-helix repeat protein